MVVGLWSCGADAWCRAGESADSVFMNINIYICVATNKLFFHACICGYC